VKGGGTDRTVEKMWVASGWVLLMGDGWVGHVVLRERQMCAGTWDKGGKHKRKRLLEDKEIDDKIIIKWILKRQDRMG
jgi:hypothetical protein